MKGSADQLIELGMSIELRANERAAGAKGLAGAAASVESDPVE